MLLDTSLADVVTAAAVIVLVYHAWHFTDSWPVAMLNVLLRVLFGAPGREVVAVLAEFPWPAGSDGAYRDKVQSDLSRRHTYLCCMKDVLPPGCLYWNARFGELAFDADTVRWHEQAHFGEPKDVRFFNEHGVATPYIAGAHSFGNTPSEQLTLWAGDVHVAIGFCDLGQLRVMNFTDAATPSNMGKSAAASAVAAAAPTSAPASAPVMWHGVEACAINVAKTLVLLRMIADASVSVDAVVEVWYSVTWRPTTLFAFRTALGSELFAQRTAASVTADVLKQLRHWCDVTPLPLSEARKRWLDKVGDASNTFNFTQQQDRIAFAAYLFSGDVLPAEEKSCASLTHFSLVKGDTAEQNVFSIVPLDVLMRLRTQHSDVTAAATAYLCAGIERLRTHLTSGRVRVTLQHALVTPGDQDLIAQLRTLRPNSVSWSNCIDYIPPRDVHRFAAAISRPATLGGTLHVAYSMNWPRNTVGAIVFDYSSAAVTHIKQQTKEVMDTWLPASARPYVLSPPLVDLMDATCFYLLHHRRLVMDAYVTAFFERADSHEQQLDVTAEPQEFHLLGNHNTDLRMRWKVFGSGIGEL